MSETVSKSRRDRLVESLREVVCDLSGHEPSDIAGDATFIELGFDSLFLTQLAQAFHNETDVDVTFRQLIEDYPSLEAIAGYFDREMPADAMPAPAPAAAPVVAVPGTAPTMAPIAVPTPPMAPIAAGNLSGLHAVFATQLAVMQEQLRMLGGVPAAASVTAATPTAAPPAAAPAEAATATPAPAEKKAKPKPKPTARPEDKKLTPHQQRYLKEFIARFAARTAKSKESTQAHRAAHADPRTASGFDRRFKEIVYPIVVDRSLGSKLWDLDRNEYIDLLCGFGPVFLGHSPPFVVEAVDRQLAEGFAVGPQTPLAGETAELVCKLTGMDRASFVCSGSEAVQAAIRCARTVTGRDRIALFRKAYHGNFDEVLVRGVGSGDRLRTFPAAPGIPRRSVEDTLVLEYGDAESLEVIRANADKLAAVLVEPVQSRRPDLQPREFLHELRRITEGSGTVLIFDEVVNGFRCHPGGAQAHFGIEADLATYGKVVAGGMPMGIVAGRKRFMDTFDGGFWEYGDASIPEAGVTFFAGTFVRHPLAIAAAHAVLTHLDREGPALQEELNARANRFAARVNAVFEEAGVQVRMPNFGSIMYIRSEEPHELASLFWHHLLERGVYASEGFPSYLSTAHTEEDLDKVVEAFRSATAAMQEARFFTPRADAEPRRGAPTPTSEFTPDRPPVEGARLGRDPSGAPAWYVPDPDRPNKYIKLS